MAVETGFHWCSPVSPENNKEAANLLEQSGRWGTVLIMPPSSEGTAQSDFVRLYYPEKLSVSQIPDINAADAWLKTHGYYNSLNYFISRGGRMIVPFNELNVSSEPQYATDPRVMAYIGYALNNAYYNNGHDRELYTLFPGPSGLLAYSDFLNYFQKYDFVDGGGKNPLTFGQAFPGNVDSKIADKTMLWHSGKGVFDRLAIHAYARNPSQFASGGPDNPALECLSWTGLIDSSTWLYVTESGGQCQDTAQPCFGDNYDAGSSLADYEHNVGDLNSGSFHSQVQAVYGYILNRSDAGATSNGWHTIGSNYINGFNNRRKQLGF